jgi:hypothetical protein
MEAQVAGNMETTADFMLAPATLTDGLEGIVMDENGEGLGGVLVQALGPEDEPVAETRSAGDGTYDLRVPAAKVPVRMHFVVPDYFEESFDVDVDGLESQNIVMALVNPNAAGSVMGRVTDGATGAGLPGVNIRAMGAELGRRAMTDAAGNFMIPGIPTGQYTFQLTTEDAQRQNAFVTVFGNGAVTTRNFAFGQAGEGEGEGDTEGEGEGDTEGTGDEGCPGSASAPPSDRLPFETILLLGWVLIVLARSGRRHDKLAPNRTAPQR